MDRSAWIKDQRRLAEERMDTLFAPLYDEKWGIYNNTTHQHFIQKFLCLVPQDSQILDAACGTGKYWSMLLEKGHTLVGIDQSQGMLARAKAKFPMVSVEKTGLQEILYHEAFDGVICVDDMEFVFPEDWLLVLNNLYRALNPTGYLYFTVEILAEQELDDAFAAGRQLGLPIVYGEWAPEGRYHYYPKIEQVKKWLQQVDFHLMDEAVGDDYHHFLVQKPQ